MISYRKSARLGIARARTPLSPFWQRSTISPYGAPRCSLLGLDYVGLLATAAPRGEISVCADPADLLSREPHPIHGPALIEASGDAETVFRRGDQILKALLERSIPSIHLIDGEGVVPTVRSTDSVTAISCWPANPADLEPMFRQARDRELIWGAVVPLLFPVTTRLDFLERIADLAAESDASFLAGIPFDLEPGAKKLLAEVEVDNDECFATLFHQDLDLIIVATERHVSALAAERGLNDFVVPPRFEERTNWNAAVMLALTGTRMVRMKRQVELGWSLLRSAREVGSMPQEIRRVAEAATLSIIETLDPLSAECLTEWLERGTATLFDEIESAWRLRRDYARE